MTDSETVDSVCARGKQIAICPQCQRKLSPDDRTEGRCNECVQGDRESLRWLGIAIESDEQSGGAVYGDTFSRHFPQWEQWRFRLEERFGHFGLSNHALWLKWIAYVHAYHDMEPEEFFSTSLESASSLLPELKGDESSDRGKKDRPRNAKSTQSKSNKREQSSLLVAKLLQHHHFPDDLNLEPLTMGEMADAINRKKSTVSRCLRDKPFNLRSYREYVDLCGNYSGLQNYLTRLDNPFARLPQYDAGFLDSLAG